MGDEEGDLGQGGSHRVRLQHHQGDDIYIMMRCLFVAKNEPFSRLNRTPEARGEKPGLAGFGLVIMMMVMMMRKVILAKEALIESVCSTIVLAKVSIRLPELQNAGYEGLHVDIQYEKHAITRGKCHEILWSTCINLRDALPRQLKNMRKAINFFFRIGPQLQEERTLAKTAQPLGWLQLAK